MEKNKLFIFDKIKLICGLALVFLGILSPLILPVSVFPIYECLQKSASGQIVWLIIAALLLVLINSLRCLPHYVGTFLIIQSLGINNRKLQMVKNILLSFVIVFLVYSTIEWLYGISYDFAVPAVLMLAAVVIVERLDFSLVSLLKEILMLVLMIAAIQFFDVFPGLNAALFGRGELSGAIKNMSSLLEADGFMRGTCLTFMCILAFSAFILGSQIALENRLRKAQAEAEERREELINTRMQLLQSRINKEQQFLVHDLKAPLTSIRIWTDLIQMKACGGDCSGCADCAEHLTHIDGLINYMNRLISEIMNSKAHGVYCVSDVMKVFSSQISPSHYNQILHTECSCPQVRLEVNRTNLVRAFINICDNAAHSIHHDHGSIDVTVSSDDEFISFVFRDNGEGISAEMLDKIWEKGVSGRNSSGIGMFFIKEVVSEVSGTVDIESTPGSGTCVTVKIPVYCE